VHFDWEVKTRRTARAHGAFAGLGDVRECALLLEILALIWQQASRAIPRSARGRVRWKLARSG